MKLRTLSIAICIPFLLTACGKKQETYTVDYLYENDDVRATVLADCAENKQTDTNCKNANDAESKKKAEEWRKKAHR